MNLLWKYKSFVRPEWIEALVLRDEIYFSSPLELNDPSETRFKFRYDYSDSYEGLLERYKRNHPGDSDEDAMEFISRLTDGREFERLERILRNELFEHFRLFCLTKTATNPLMWAHYADNHTGICVGLDADRIIQACQVVVDAVVRYQDEPFSLVFDPEENTESILRRLAVALFTKDSRWAYEQEVRFVSFMQPAAQVAPGVVRKIVLGLRTTVETRRQVMSWKQSKSDLEILQVQPAKLKSYEFDLSPV